MHQIPQYQTTITLFSRDGEFTTYPSLRAALKALGERWISNNVGTHFRVFDHASRRWSEARGGWVSEPVYVERDYIMRDDAGDVVTAATFSPLIKRRWHSRWFQKWETWNGEGPVPGVRCWRGGRHYFRRPKTTAERRAAVLVLKEEGEVAPRAARNFVNLPNTWDDEVVANRNIRNWKRYRRTQWKR